MTSPHRPAAFIATSILIGGLVGILPAAVGRFTFLAPTPGGGLADLGVVILMLMLGAVGITAGLLIGYFLALHRLRKTGHERSANRLVVALLFLPMLPIALLFAHVPIALGVILLACVGTAWLLTRRRTSRAR